MIRPQQVAHLFVAARAGMAVGKAVAERQPFVRRGRKEGVETEVADTFGAVFERIDGMSARHAVAGDQLVPANLRIARVVRPPCQFGFPVARIAGQVTVIVGHGRTGVVPPQGAVFPHPVFGPGSHVEPGRGRQPHAVRSGGQRHELAPHARIADFAVLETPGRIVEVVARKAESLFDRREACAPYRRWDDKEESQRMALAEMPGGTESRRQGIREDAFDVHVAPRAGLDGGSDIPAVARRPRKGEFRPGQVVAVGETDGGVVRRFRERSGEAEGAYATSTADGLGQCRDPGTALFPSPEQPQRTEIAGRNPQPGKGGRLRGVMLPAAAERDVGQIEGRNAAVEVGHGLDCPVEKRGVGKHDGRTLLITRAIGIVFVVGELGRSSAHDEQENHGKSVFAEHAQGLFRIQI